MMFGELNVIVLLKLPAGHHYRNSLLIMELSLKVHDFLDENSKESCQMTQIDSILEILVCTEQRT